MSIGNLDDGSTKNDVYEKNNNLIENSYFLFKKFAKECF